MKLALGINRAFDWVKTKQELQEKYDKIVTLVENSRGQQDFGLQPGNPFKRNENPQCFIRVFQEQASNFCINPAW